MKFLSMWFFAVSFLAVFGMSFPVLAEQKSALFSAQKDPAPAQRTVVTQPVREKTAVQKSSSDSERFAQKGFVVQKTLEGISPQSADPAPAQQGRRTTQVPQYLYKGLIANPAANPARVASTAGTAQARRSAAGGAGTTTVYKGLVVVPVATTVQR